MIQILHILNFHNDADIFGETFILDNKNIIVFPLMPLAEKITFVHAMFQQSGLDCLSVFRAIKVFQFGVILWKISGSNVGGEDLVTSRLSSEHIKPAWSHHIYSRLR